MCFMLVSHANASHAHYPFPSSPMSPSVPTLDSNAWLNLLTNFIWMLVGWDVQNLWIPYFAASQKLGSKEDGIKWPKAGRQTCFPCWKQLQHAGQLCKTLNQPLHMLLLVWINQKYTDLWTAMLIDWLLKKIKNLEKQ